MTIDLWNTTTPNHQHSSINTSCQFSILKDADIKSPTTPCQFDMWNNACVPRWDVHPLLIELSVTNPTTPFQFDMWKEADVPMWDVPPSLPPPAISWRRGVLHDMIFVFVTQICKNAKISYTDMFYCSFQFIPCEDSHV